MDFPTRHPENKALNLLDSAVTLLPEMHPELREWVGQLSTTIARPVEPPQSLQALARPGSEEVDLEHETYLLGQALCTYRREVYPGGVATPSDPGGAARDDLDSAMSRFEERLARAKPHVELENTPGSEETGSEEAGPEPR